MPDNTVHPTLLHAAAAPIYWRLFGIGMCLLCLVLWQTPTEAQQTRENGNVTVNYVYAQQFGLGGYDVGGLSVQVYPLPLPYTLHFGRNNAWGLKMTPGLTYGRFDFDADVDNIPNSGDELAVTLHTLGGTVALELQIPVLDNWMLKPFVEGGLVGVLHTDVSPAALAPSIRNDLAYTYAVGLRSRFHVDWQRFTFTLGNGLLYAGNATFKGKDAQAYAALETGIDIRHPLGLTIKQYAPDFSVFFIHYHFFPALEFSRFLHTPLEVNNQFEFGVTLGTVPPLPLGIIAGLRLGVSYRFGDNLTGIRLNLGFPF